jgi:hypothetical protein
VQNRIGAVVERLKGWNDAAPMDPDEGSREQLGWQLAEQVGVRIVPRQRRSRNMQGFGKILIIASTKIHHFAKIHLARQFGHRKQTASAGERPVSSLSCALSPRSTKGSSSDHVAAAASARSASLRQRCSLLTAPFDPGW